MIENRSNIALVVLDTLRKDAFDTHFGWLDGVQYKNAWSTSHWTAPAHASMFTGRYGGELGVHGKSKHLDCPERTISELLQAEGWTTRGYSNNIHVSHWFDFNRGFDEFQNDTHGDDLGFNWAEFISDHRYEGPVRYLKLLQKVHESDAPTLPTLKQGIKIKFNNLDFINSSTGDSGAADTFRWIQNTQWNDGGEFLFINLMEAHAPYEAPKEYQTVEPASIDGPKASIVGSPETDVAHLKAAYANCVNYLSDIYKEIYDELANNFDVIVTVADHGEAFGEYGGWEHFCGLWPAVTRIPLVISVESDLDKPVSTNAPVSLLDIHATLCSYTGIDPPSGSRGTSLTNDVDREHHLTETHGLLTMNRRRLINEGISEETLDQYDVELYGVSANQGYTFEDFDKTLIHHDGGVDESADIIQEFTSEIQTRYDKTEHDIPDHVEDRLEELGYA